MKKILVIGSGGREHALVWKLKQSDELEKIYCIPGNAGIARQAECPQVNAADCAIVESFIRENEINLTVIGPEQPLVAGMVDYLSARGHLVFGPNQRAAQMEGSKIFAKKLMQKYKIPTANYGAFEDIREARRYLDKQPEGPIVLKADGLAAGKGSLICENKASALDALRQMMVEKVFAEAGARVVIEEFMEGPEASLFVLTDGRDYLPLTPAQDYKRLLDGDRGLNTGGMGSYAPVPVFTEELYRKTISKIVEPTLNALQSEGIDYRGLLYVGLMLTAEGPKVVEFNCRFGDPETQVVLPLLETDLAVLMEAAVRGRLGAQMVQFSKKHAVCVVAASGGYPGGYQKGKEIAGLDQVPAGVQVFHAGTAENNGRLVTNGGRVLGVTATGISLQQAAQIAYGAMEKISFEGMFYRRDISRRAW